MSDRHSGSEVNQLLLKHFCFSVHRFEGKNEPFLVENASNLTHEFLYDNFNKKI